MTPKPTLLVVKSMDSNHGMDITQLVFKISITEKFPLDFIGIKEDHICKTSEKFYKEKDRWHEILKCFICLTYSKFDPIFKITQQS